MRAWSGEQNGDNIMGPAVTRASSPKGVTPPALKNGKDMRESGYLISVGSRTSRFRRKHKEKMWILILLIVIFFLLVFSLSITTMYIRLKRMRAEYEKVCRTKECLRSAANLAMSMDKTADPCEDFHRYVCGNWGKEHPRSNTESNDWFQEKQNTVLIMIRDFLVKNETDLKPNALQEAKNMYATCIDIETADKRGVKPIFDTLEVLGLPQVPTILNITEGFDYESYSFDWLATVIKVKTLLAMDVLIGFDMFHDARNSSVYKLALGSPENTNPFPSIYRDRKKFKYRKTVKKPLMAETGPDNVTYLFHFSRYFETEDDEDTNSKKQKLYRLYYAEITKRIFLESDGAKSSHLAEEELDKIIIEASDKFVTTYISILEMETHNSTSDDETIDVDIPDYTVDEIQKQTDAAVEANNDTPVPIWKTYLDGVFEISNIKLDYENDKIILTDLDLEYLKNLAAFVAKTPPVVLELYIWIQVVDVMIIHTTSEFRTLYNRYYNELKGKHGSGEPARSIECSNVVNEMFGMAIAYGIADKKFLNETKPKVEEMINEIKNSLSRLIGKAKWMDDETKLASYEKINKMKSLIGYPEWFHEEGKLDEFYEGIKINNESHLDNMISVVHTRLYKALNSFRDWKVESWATDPTEVNAYHTFQDNTITVPIVMLQYPFYNLGIDSLNYGSLGTILGHEITHGFDNLGRRFDGNGNFAHWWSNESIKSFINNTQCFVDQYSSIYLPEIDQHVDGKKTLGENIADNGGVSEAFGAFREHFRKVGKEKQLPGFETMSPEQMFFLSYANLWCSVSTKESLESQILDPHTPQIVRAHSALRNHEEFAKSWKCPANTYMNPSKRCVMY